MYHSPIFLLNPKTKPLSLSFFLFLFLSTLMAEDQGSHAIDFHLGNHLLVSSNSDNSGESKNNMKPLNQQNEEGEALVNKKRNREIASENEKDNITSDEGLDGKHPESNNEMFDDLRGLLPQLPSEVCV